MGSPSVCPCQVTNHYSKVLTHLARLYHKLLPLLTIDDQAITCDSHVLSDLESLVSLCVSLLSKLRKGIQTSIQTNLSFKEALLTTVLITIKIDTFSGIGASAIERIQYLIQPH